VRDVDPAVIKRSLLAFNRLRGQRMMHREGFSSRDHDGDAMREWR